MPLPASPVKERGADKKAGETARERGKEGENLLPHLHTYCHSPVQACCPTLIMLVLMPHCRPAIPASMQSITLMLIPGLLLQLSPDSPYILTAGLLPALTGPCLASHLLPQAHIPSPVLACFRTGQLDFEHPAGSPCKIRFKPHPSCPLLALTQ